MQSDIKASKKPRPTWMLSGLLLVSIAVMAGVFAATVVHSIQWSGLDTSLLGANTKIFWYLSRASAMVAYLLIWLSMVLGLGITNRLAHLWPGGPTANELHQHIGLLGLAFATLHPLLLLGDRYINYELAQLLIPFASTNYRQVAVGIGQIGIYLLAILVLSFYVRKYITARWWRVIHMVSFAVFLLVTAHGLASGTDSTDTWALAIYWGSSGSVLFLTIYRILVRRYTRSNPVRFSGSDPVTLHSKSGFRE